MEPSTVTNPPKPSRLGTWAPLVVLAAGIGLMVVWLQRNPFHPAQALPDSGGTLVRTRQPYPPSHFGLPDYPGASGYVTFLSGQSIGNISFSLRDGSPLDVIRFYRMQLAPLGWKLTLDQATSTPAPRDDRGQPLGPGSGMLPGRTARWRREKQERLLAVSAVDFPQKNGTRVEVSLSWGPATEPP
jgi:hypothetical protein